MANVPKPIPGSGAMRPRRPRNDEEKQVVIPGPATIFVVIPGPARIFVVIPGPAEGRNPESVYLHRSGLDQAVIATMISERPVREPAVYILATKPYGTLYVGVTSDLVKRIWEHRNDAVEGFTKRHGVHRLVHFEQFRSMVEAIEREKELKKWRRAWKIALIENSNPDWCDLWPEISQ